MAILIKKNGNLVSVGESSKVEVVTDYLDKMLINSGSDTFTYTNNDLITINGNSTFQWCVSITELNFPNATTIFNFGNWFCDNATNLETVNMPKITQLGERTFGYCSKLSNINIENCTRLGNSCFMGCTSLTNINVPKWGSVGSSNTFSYCSNLKTITCGLKTMYNSLGTNISSLESITLLSTTMCVLGSTSYIPATASQHLTIYVPSDLISSYQAATNWSTLYNNGYISFVAIS